MKKIKILAVMIVLAACASEFISCSSSYNTIKRRQKKEEKIESPSSEAELEAAISRYERRAERINSEHEQDGMWHKVAGIRYFDSKMFSKAYESFEKASFYYGDNATLYYYMGLCAVNMARSCLDYDSQSKLDEKKSWFKKADEAYTKAISIKGDYYDALYAASVLYVFESDDEEKTKIAVRYLESYTAVRDSDTNALFTLGRAYVELNEYKKACDIYDRIIRNNPGSSKAAEAMMNKSQVENYMAGSR